MRTHPIIIAQAAATIAAMFDGRFFLGVETCERSRRSEFRRLTKTRTAMARYGRWRARRW
jgi:alkanesulfonate monooxygenase SsuD/methylene tetrahydromethanopterin reductase-like flavin-dependent oxidoreductase (luciferase family)